MSRAPQNQPDEREYHVVYWPTDRVCVTYDTREEAEASVRWYLKSYGSMTKIGVREASPRHGNTT